jgi:hypothetical protein
MKMPTRAVHFDLEAEVRQIRQGADLTRRYQRER